MGKAGTLQAFLLLAWAALVWANYWPDFAFPFDWSWRAFVSTGFAFGFDDVRGALGVHLKHALLAVLTLAAARGAGGRFCPLLKLRAHSLVAALPAGLVFLSMAVFGLGLAGLLKSGILAAVLLAGAAGNMRFRFSTVPAGGNGLAILAVAAVALAALPAALAPEVTYDALAYHLGAPELYMKTGRIVRAEGMFFTDLPLGLQMIYLLPVSLGGSGAAKLIHWALGLGCLGQAAILGRAAGGGAAGRWSLVLLAATPLLAIQMMKANVDLGVVFLTSAGIYWLLRCGERSLVMAALCLGASAAVKLTGGYGVIAGLAVLGFRRLRFAPVWLAAAALPLLPWMARSFLATGSPLYPFLWEFLGGLGWSAESRTMYGQDMTGPTSFNLQYPSPIDRLAGPWLMVMNDTGKESALGPFVLTVVPAFVWLRASLPATGRALARFAFIYWLVWFVTARDPRFFLPAWPALCALAALTLCGLRSRAGTILRVCFVTAVVFTPFFISGLAYRLFHPAPVAWGAVTRLFYEDRMIPPGGFFKPLLREADRTASGRGRILVVGDVKAPGCEAPALYPSMFDLPHIVSWTRLSRDASRLRVKFRQRNVASVFYNVGGAVYLRDHFGHFGFNGSSKRVLREFWERYLEPVREAGKASSGIGVYRVRLEPGARVTRPIPGETP